MKRKKKLCAEMLKIQFDATYILNYNFNLGYSINIITLKILFIIDVISKNLVSDKSRVVKFFDMWTISATKELSPLKP